MRAGGRVPAFGTQPGRNNPLVYFDKTDKRPAKYFQELPHVRLSAIFVKLLQHFHKYPCIGVILFQYKAKTMIGQGDDPVHSSLNRAVATGMLPSVIF